MYTPSPHLVRAKEDGGSLSIGTRAIEKCESEKTGGKKEKGGRECVGNESVGNGERALGRRARSICKLQDRVNRSANRKEGTKNKNVRRTF